MNTLINVQNHTIGQHTVPTVNARELHAFLESKQKFADWINNRIQQYGFSKDVDFLIVSENYETNTKDGQRRISVRNEYFITLNMAKELSMVERTAKGREARQYFIACEQQLYTLQAQQLQQARQSQMTKHANWHLTQLIYTLKNVVHNQQRAMNKIVNLHEQSLQLQAQSLALLQRQSAQTSTKSYRQATSEDIDLVHDLLEQGHTFNQISQKLGISTYAINRIKHHRYTHDEQGGRLSYLP